MATATQTISQPWDGLDCNTGVDNFKAFEAPAKPTNNDVDHAPCTWTFECHPRLHAVEKEVEEYFLRNWNFGNGKAVHTFLNAKFSEVTCLYFPLALDDRIHFACRLLTVLFLIDGKSNRAPCRIHVNEAYRSA